MELLRQAMLQHEIVFRHQVRELHRLYWTQRSFMLCRSSTEDAKVGLDVVLPVDLLGNQKGSSKANGFDYGDEKQGACDQNTNCSHFGFRGQIDQSTKENQSESYKATDVAPDSSSGRHPFISFLRQSSNKCSKAISTVVHPVDSNSASKGTCDSFHCHQVSRHSGSDASAHNVQIIEDGCDNNQQKVENGHHDSDSDSDASVKLQRNSAVVHSSGFGGHAQDNANAKMLSSITEIEIRNFSAPFGERVRHVHSDNGQQTSTLTSGDNVDNTNLRVSVGSTEQPPTVTRDSKNKQANCEESEEDTLSSHTTARDEEQQGKCSKDIPVVSKFDCAGADDEWGSGDACPEKHKVPSIPEESETTQTELQVLESYPIKHSLVSQTCGQCFLQIDPSILGKPKHGDESEWDSLIFPAYQYIGCLYLHIRRNVLHIILSGFEAIEAEEIEEPQYSSDSFETLTMGLPEITSDKYTMPAIPSKKVSGNDACKLRRGKGLRDFQKDILPGLASLSRHEIREDFHNIEHALRKSRSRNRENWPIPVRSQRSRRFYRKQKTTFELAI
ncbi:hypothetical protein J5N97_029884 [Dioscorea zingiberensis]|uniref:Uncharacterized protein n=1 Tax=Dioscorea zingiberensis TaxID=325984 RepID=A0A9D5H3Q6_9LILI|nr:hypothetical protein J5N97_029884 [Dioscorea zingiberensis]